MDQMQFIQVNETYNNEIVIIRFMVNKHEVLPKIEFKLTNEISEQYSQVLYDHLSKFNPKECHFLYFDEPLRCIQKQRFNLITSLSSDVILKILNLKYIPIIRTNYSNYQSDESNKEGGQSIIQRLNLQWQAQSKTKSKITKELLQIINDFNFNYRIEILIRSTLKQIQRETYQEYDVLYVPTDELIFLKTNQESSLSKCFPYLEQMNNSNQVK
ncbi:unnamed protein product [Paramecium sonneborni]|uniref:Uncharacterized protein n=1 Tax=Paramecium sonneborni TaxID=65129 RepID=A0A8S1KNN2_9CILI|nr:unnamed protein product [Paramecium sonneborni]